MSTLIRRPLIAGRPLLALGATVAGLLGGASCGLRADPLDEVYWRTFFIAPIGAYDQTPGSSNSIFLFRERLLALTGGGQPPNVKVGFSMTANFISSTHGRYYDYIYSPAYAPWETDANLALARASDLPLGLHINGTPWADPAQQAVDVLSNFLEKQGGGALLQVDRLGRIRNASRTQDPAADEVFDGFADMLEMQLTLSRNATVVQEYLGRNARIVMRLLDWYREQHPDLLVFTSTSSEYAQNVAANSEYCDYSEWSKQEFRDWLGGMGLYTGRGQYADLAALNNDANVNGAVGAGFPFASWSAVVPPTNVNWSTTSDTGRWWRKWHDFRINQVSQMVQQQLQWGFESGWSPDFLFGHQIPFNPATTSETERKYASPWTTTFAYHGGNGITTYGSWASNTSLFNAIYANDHNWGIQEWNPLDSSSVANNLAALNSVWASGAHAVCPYAWYGQPTYQIYGQPLETAIAQFVSNRFAEAFTGLSAWETTAAARDLIWTMSRPGHLEAVEGAGALTFNRGVVSGWTSNSAAWLTLEFNESPTRHIVSDGFHAASFRLNVQAALAGLGQFEWQDASGATGSLPFTAKAGWNVYRLNLAEHAPWREKRIQRLRFRPCSAPGVRFELDWFRLEANRCWHFDDPNEVFSANQLTNLAVTAGQVSAVSGPDGYFYLATDKRNPAEDADRAVINADYYKKVRLRMTASTPGVAELFWWKRGSSFFRTEFPVQAGTRSYEVDLTSVPDWNGIVTRFRLDPVNTAGTVVSVDYLSLSPILLPPRMVDSDIIVNSTQPLCRWEPAQEPDHAGVTAELQLATDFFFTNVVYQTNGLRGGRHVVTGMALDGLHWWRLRAVDAAGVVSPWSHPLPLFLRPWQMERDGDIAHTNQIGSVSAGGGVWQGVSTGGDPYLVFNSGGSIDRGINTDLYKRFRCRVKVGPAGGGNLAQFFFFPKSGGFVSTNLNLPADGLWREIELDFSTVPQWTGYLHSVRLDPTTFSGAIIALDFAELLPGADRLAAAGNWQFNTPGDLEGWLPSGDASAIVSNGVCSLAVAGAGAFLEIAPLRMQGARTLSVRIRNQTAATTARLYWGTETSATADLTRSVAFAIQPQATNFVTYQVDLSTNAALAGQVVSWLRLAPAEGAASGRVDLDLIVLGAGPNQPPTFVKGPDQTLLEDAGPQMVSNWATAISPGPAGEAWQTVSFICSNSHPARFSVQPAVSPTGTLSFTPAANANGTTVVTVWARDDGGTADGGQDTSPPQAFNLNITAVNDAPSFVKGPDLVVAADSGPQVFPNWATELDRGAPDEAGQAVSFTVTNGNNALFSVQPAINPLGTLTFTPAPGAVGVAGVGVRMFDSGGTANGGVNASAWQTFTITIQALNRPPVAEPDAFHAHTGATTAFSAADLLANDSDPDGDPLTLSGATAGANTSSAILTANQVRFTPLPGFAGLASFNYLVTDGRGGQATGSVSVTVVEPRITGWSLLEAGTLRLVFAGIPSNGYQLQTTTNFQDWQAVSTNTTDADGFLHVEQPASAPARFYRFQWP